MNFQELIRATRKPGESVYQGRLLCLDPGHTTGWALFEGLELKEFGQLDTPEVNGVLIPMMEFFKAREPLNDLIYEDYRVYGWRAKHHAFSELHTAKLIGVIEAVAQSIVGLNIYKQMASVAKQWAKDEFLKEWGFFQQTVGQKHARDAVRHGCYFVSFGGKDKWHERPGRTRGKTVG